MDYLTPVNISQNNRQTAKSSANTSRLDGAMHTQGHGIKPQSRFAAKSIKNEAQSSIKYLAVKQKKSNTRRFLLDYAGSLESRQSQTKRKLTWCNSAQRSIWVFGLPATPKGIYEGLQGRVAHTVASHLSPATLP